MRILLATCTVYTWLIGRVSTVTGTVDTRPIVEFFVVKRLRIDLTRVCVPHALTHGFPYVACGDSHCLPLLTPASSGGPLSLGHHRHFASAWSSRAGTLHPPLPHHFAGVLFDDFICFPLFTFGC
jgi:hypothetical protein